jgi:peptidoglycan hydrolase CwlO-like protein
MVADLNALRAQVAQNNNVIQSAIVLINGIAARIAQAAGDPAALQAIIDDLNNQDTQLAQAVAANTPAASTSTQGTASQPQTSSPSQPAQGTPAPTGTSTQQTGGVSPTPSPGA